MKNILKVLFLIGLSGNFLIAAKMYVVDETNPGSFTVTAGDPPIGDAYYTVGVTIAPFDNHGTDEWELTDAKLNPVHMLNDAFFIERGIGGAPGHYYLAQVTALSESENQFTYEKMVLNDVQHQQYTGQPLFMLYDAWANTAGDYKGDSFPTGEAVLRFFPVLDMAQFTTAGGGYLDYHYKIEGETTWNKCNTITSGPNGAVATEDEVFGDLTDHYPVETVWDAKTELGTGFNENIVVRIRAKYGTEAFTSAPTDSGSGSPSPGSGETFVVKTGGIIIDVPDTVFEDFNGDGTMDGLDKIMQIVQLQGLENVGTYNDGAINYSVFYFTSDALGQFNNGAGKPAGNYAAYGAQLIEVEPGSASGS